MSYNVDFEFVIEDIKKGVYFYHSKIKKYIDDEFYCYLSFFGIHISLTINNICRLRHVQLTKEMVYSIESTNIKSFYNYLENLVFSFEKCDGSSPYDNGMFDFIKEPPFNINYFKKTDGSLIFYLTIPTDYINRNLIPLGCWYYPDCYMEKEQIEKLFPKYNPKAKEKLKQINYNLNV